MKLHYSILLLAFLAVAIALPTQQAKAQGDTLTVEWGDASGVPIPNALRDVIAADTVGGRNPNRVYKLLKGGFYWNTERIENDGFTLRLVGETPGNTVLDNPAVLQMVVRTDGTTDGRLITGKNSVTLKNLWLTGRDDNNVQTYYQPIQIDANDGTFIIDNCVIERTNFALIAFTGKRNKIFFTNCKFRNLIGQPSTQQWEGRGTSIWADQDSVVVENCTFFNIEMTALQIEGGSSKYVRWNHNTVVNLGRTINTGNWFQEAYFANTLVINGFWHGEGNTDLSSASRDTINGAVSSQSGIFSIGLLPSQYGPEKGRRIVFTNAAAWLDPKFVTFYGDSIHRQYFINELTKRRMSKYSAMVVKDTTWLTSRPDVGTYPDTLVEDMINHINDLRTGAGTVRGWFWAVPEYPTDVSWPLPENFAYTTSSLLTAGTDGLPLGDLNWFPTQKAQFEANKAAFVKAIEDMAGPRIKLEVVATKQAEAGTLAGTAAISTFSGFSYFNMDGGGFLEWTFDMAAAGAIDLNIWTHMRNNTMRGTHTSINGVEIHDSAHGWGELIYDNALGVTNGMVINDWTWVKWTQADIKEAGSMAVVAGSNVIKLWSSWGWQNWAGVDILAAGTNTVLKSLRAPDVTSYEIVQPRGQGAAWTPNGFKSVKLGASGSITWTMDVAAAGTYRLNFFYQNVGGAQTGQVSVDGAAVIASLPLENKADSTELVLLSDSFNMTAGSHTVTLTAGAANIDYVQLIRETSSSVKRNVLPEGYALEQNYPNPFNPNTTINFSIGKASNVKLTIYNILGQQVITLLDQRMKEGAHMVQFDASRLASGIYFYRLEAGDVKTQRRMLFIK